MLMSQLVGVHPLTHPTGMARSALLPNSRTSASSGSAATEDRQPDEGQRLAQVLAWCCCR